MISFWIFLRVQEQQLAIFEQNKEWHFSQKYYIQLPEVLLESNREQKAATLFV
jgi:hypothetical protein